MRIRDKFSSMEEVKEFLDKEKNNFTEEEYSLIKKVLGMGEQEGDSLLVEGIGEIDKSIVPLIKSLNDKELKTLSSCSGVFSEHPSWEEEQNGYIAFHLIHSEEVKLAADELGLVYSEGETYFNPSCTIRVEGDDDTKMQKWSSLLNYINKKNSTTS